MFTSAEELIEHSGPMASLPEVFYRVNEAVEDPECSFAEIAHIFGRELGDDEKSMLEGRVQGMMHKGNCTRQELIDQIKSLLRNKSSK